MIRRVYFLKNSIVFLGRSFESYTVRMIHLFLFVLKCNLTILPSVVFYLFLLNLKNADIVVWNSEILSHNYNFSGLIGLLSTPTIKLTPTPIPKTFISLTPTSSPTPKIFIFLTPTPTPSPSESEFGGPRRSLTVIH